MKHLFVFLAGIFATIAFMWMLEYSTPRDSCEQAVYDHQPKAVLFIVYDPNAKHRWEHFGGSGRYGDTDTIVYRDLVDINNIKKRVKIIVSSP